MGSKKWLNNKTREFAFIPSENESEQDFTFFPFSSRFHLSLGLKGKRHYISIILEVMAVSLLLSVNATLGFISTV